MTADDLHPPPICEPRRGSPTTLKIVHGRTPSPWPPTGSGNAAKTRI